MDRLEVLGNDSSYALAEEEIVIEKCYKGICLLPLLGKVRERIVVNRLLENLNEEYCPW